MATDSITIRTKFKNGITDIRCRIEHPMDSGLCDDEKSEAVAHFIQKVTIYHNNEVACSVEMGTGVSENPFFAVQIQDTKKGDTISISWADNKGMSDSNKTTIN